MSEGRYEKCAITSYQDGPDKIQYLQRRFLPKAREIGTLGETRVGDGERLDQLATRLLDNPLLFWKVADSNEAMNPFSLEEETTVKIPKP